MLQNNMQVDANVISSPFPQTFLFSSPYADCLVLYLHRGVLSISIGQCHWFLKPGDIFVLPANIEATICEYEGVTNNAILIHVFNVEMSESAFRKSSISSSWFNNRPFVINSLFMHGYEVYRCFDMMLSAKHEKKYVWDNIEICYFFIAMLLILRVKVSENEPMQYGISQYHHDVHAIAAAIYSEFSVSSNIRALCGQYNMSYSTLSRHFQKIIKMTPVDFRNYIRVWEARDLLLHTNHDVSKIAGIIGFSDYRYFDRLFTRIIGKPPLLFRTDYGYDKIHISP